MVKVVSDLTLRIDVREGLIVDSQIKVIAVLDNRERVLSNVEWIVEGSFVAAQKKKRVRCNCVK